MAKAPVRAAAGVIRAFQIHTAEDAKPVEQRDGNKYGVTSGLNITHFCNELMMQNYTDQLDDVQLADILRTEFPNRAIIQSIPAYRGYFNGGQHGFGTGEKLPPDNRLLRFKSQQEEAEAQGNRDAKKAAKQAAKNAAAPPAQTGRQPAARSQAAPAGRQPVAAAAPRRAAGKPEGQEPAATVRPARPARQAAPAAVAANAPARRAPVKR